MEENQIDRAAVRSGDPHLWNFRVLGPLQPLFGLNFQVTNFE
jgi:hypothetical protein